MQTQDQNIIAKDGKPQYFLVDKRIPVNLEYEKLRPFDEIQYVSDIARFIESNTTDVKISEVVDSYVDRDFSSLQPFFVKVLTEKYNLSQKTLNNTPRSQVLKMLYDLGCPKLLVFHKTAVETARYGTESWGANAQIVNPNPLTHKMTGVTAEYKYVYNYLRPEDKYPFIMSLPLEDIVRAEDQYYGSIGQKVDGTDFGVQSLFLEHINDDQLSEITGKMRVFSVDKDRFKKLSTFQKSVRK